MPHTLVLTASLSPCAPQVDGEYDAWMEVLCLVYHGGASHNAELRVMIVPLHLRHSHHCMHASPRSHCLPL